MASPQAAPGRRELLVSRGWIQAAILVFLFGFTVLGILAWRTYTGEPPIPARVVDPAGRVLFTAADVRHGQEVFLRNGLMEYGTIFGHGAYVGPDFTADYLHRAALDAQVYYKGQGSPDPSALALSDFKANRYDASSGTLVFTEAQAAAFYELYGHYRSFFSQPNARLGLRPHPITDPEQVRQLTVFFAWSAWASAALRPGLAYSYTNNWPPEPLVGNHASADVVLWSVLSLVALLGGIGLLMAVFGRWNFLGWHGRERSRIRFRAPNQVRLTPAQRVTAWFFFVMAALFLVQTLLGGATEHYRADISSFFGLNLAVVFPFNVTRTWHVQLAIFWVATAFLAAGIFLAPMIAGSEPRGQDRLTRLLLAALVIVVVGSLAGEYAGIEHWIHRGWSWFGDQGFEYLDLGRFWQILLTVGLVFWVVILYRGLRGRLRRERIGNMPWLFLFAALAIPAFYAVGLLARPNSEFTTTDFWRFWVVHLWVEDFLELFTTVLVAYLFVLLGVVDERVALTMIYLDAILYSAGGVIGTMHHLYFSGEPAVHMALGAFFSAAEVIPLTLLTLDAWSFLQLGAVQQIGRENSFPHYWAVMFLAAVGFWNFLGAGVFGFLINLPIVSYYEIGTALTLNHGHAAMMGVYGMLAVGLALFCLRYIVPEDRWSERAERVSFWSLNLGLAWMCFASLFPVGLLQLYHSVAQGYWYARSLQFLTLRDAELFEWLRFPGDAIFILGGVLPLLYLAWQGIRARPSALAASTEPGREALFTEVIEPASRVP